MKNIVLSLVIVASSWAATAHAQTVAREVLSSVRNSYGRDVNAGLAVTRVLGDWNSRVIHGEPVNQNTEIRFYVSEFRKYNIDLCQIATPPLARLIKINGL